MNEHPEAEQYREAAPELERAAGIVPALYIEDVAITRLCHRRGGMRCWQYNPECRALPTWVGEWVNFQGNGKLEFCDRNGSTNIIFNSGDWLVVFDECTDAVVYSAEEFANLFELVAP